MRWRFGVDGVSASVDDNVVVEPTQGGEVLSISGTALRPRGDVVWLEPVPAHAASDGADSAVAGEDESAQSGWDGAASSSHVDRCAVSGSPGYFDDPVAQDRFDRVSSDSGSGFDHRSGFTVRLSGVIGVDEDGQQRCRGFDRGAVCACEGVEAHGPESVGVTGCAAASSAGWELIGLLVEGFNEGSACHGGELPVNPP